MRLLIVTQYFPPEAGATQVRLSELAVRLQEKGHAVTVLTAMPNYPTGQVFEGYRRKLVLEEDFHGIRVVRTWVWPSKSQREWLRLFCYVSFLLSSVLLGGRRLGQYDLVFCDSPPIFLAPVGAWFGRRAGGRVVFNVADIWPEALLQTGHRYSKPLLAGLLRLERWAYEHAKVVTLTNPGAAKLVQARFPHVPVGVISNGVDRTLFRPELRNQAVRDTFGVGPGDFMVIFAGLHGVAQGLEVVVRAAHRLRDNPAVKFVMIGDGPLKADMVKLAGELGVPNMQFHPPRPKKEIPAILASSDASLVPLSVRMPGTMPSKIYEAMASGVPVLVVKGCEGEAFVTEHGVGRAFEPMDDGELAGTLADLAGRRGELDGIRRNCIELSQRFDRDRIAQRAEALLTAVAEGRPLPPIEW